MANEERRYQSNVNPGLVDGALADAATTGSHIARKGAEIVSELSTEAKKIGSAAADRADGALSSVGGTMIGMADSIRHNAPSEGTFGSAAGGLAEGLRSSGEYLSRHGVSDISKDMTGIVRKYPFYSLCIGLGVGALLGTVLSRK